jgi:hypothetical protein
MDLRKMIPAVVVGVSAILGNPLILGNLGIALTLTTEHT